MAGKYLYDIKLIRSFAIVLNNDQSTQVRREELGNARQVIKNFAEWFLLESELNAVQQERKALNTQLNAKELLLKEDYGHLKEIVTAYNA